MGREERVRDALLHAAPLVILDRYGREIREGCEIALASPTFCGVVVESITPALQANMPADAVRVRAICRYEFYLPKGQAQPNFLLLRDRTELEAAGIVKRRETEDADASPVDLSLVPDPRD